MFFCLWSLFVCGPRVCRSVDHALDWSISGRNCLPWLFLNFQLRTKGLVRPSALLFVLSRWVWKRALEMLQVWICVWRGCSLCPLSVTILYPCYVLSLGSVSVSSKSRSDMVTVWRMNSPTVRMRWWVRVRRRPWRRRRWRGRRHRLTEYRRPRMEITWPSAPSILERGEKMVLDSLVASLIIS